jgi:hypothetical protein
MSKYSKIQLSESCSASTENLWSSENPSLELQPGEEEKSMTMKLDKKIFLILLLIQVLTAWEKSSKLNSGHGKLH